MGINAQFGKQRALQQLRTLFLQHDLSKDTLDVHHRVLAALLALSRRPLQHHYTAPSFLSRLQPGNSLDAGRASFFPVKFHPQHCSHAGEIMHALHEYILHACDVLSVS